MQVRVRRSLRLPAAHDCVSPTLPGLLQLLLEGSGYTSHIKAQQVCAQRRLAGGVSALPARRLAALGCPPL